MRAGLVRDIFNNVIIGVGAFLAAANIFAGNYTVAAGVCIITYIYWQLVD
jgi:hypothetical protein